MSRKPEDETGPLIPLSYNVKPATPKPSENVPAPRAKCPNCGQQLAWPLSVWQIRPCPVCRKKSNLKPKPAKFIRARQSRKLPSPEEARKLWKPLARWGYRGARWLRLISKNQPEHQESEGRSVRALSTVFETNRRRH
jgi:hypothetical protein